MLAILDGPPPGPGVRARAALGGGGIPRLSSWACWKRGNRRAVAGLASAHRNSSAPSPPNLPPACHGKRGAGNDPPASPERSPGAIWVPRSLLRKPCAAPSVPAAPPARDPTLTARGAGSRGASCEGNSGLVREHDASPRHRSYRGLRLPLIHPRSWRCQPSFWARRERVRGASAPVRGQPHRPSRRR